MAMMIEQDVSSDQVQINFGANGAEAILQNVRTILATSENSCPMNRDFAWSPVVDDPLPIAQARLTARVTEAIRRYEPRAEVVNIRFEGDPLNGILRPIVRVRINDEI